jgi:hypothetical protein
MVGPNPAKSTRVRVTTAHKGFDVKNQQGKAESATKKNNQSALVITVSPRFEYVSRAM